MTLLSPQGGLVKTVCQDGLVGPRLEVSHLWSLPQCALWTVIWKMLGSTDTCYLILMSWSFYVFALSFKWVAFIPWTAGILRIQKPCFPLHTSTGADGIRPLLGTPRPKGLVRQRGCRKTEFVHFWSPVFFPGIPITPHTLGYHTNYHTELYCSPSLLICPARLLFTITPWPAQCLNHCRNLLTSLSTFTLAFYDHSSSLSKIFKMETKIM